MERERMRKLFVFVTVASGVVAAYLMYRRGESLPTIAIKAVTNPVCSLFSEMQSVREV